MAYPAAHTAFTKAKLQIILLMQRLNGVSCGVIIIIIIMRVVVNKTRKMNILDFEFLNFIFCIHFEFIESEINTTKSFSFA